MALTDLDVTDDELAALLQLLRTTRPSRGTTHRRKRSGRSRAVIYIRVSSRGQLETDFDPDGLSIPAQEEVGRRKAVELDADVVRIFVDKAESGTKIENRHELLQLLSFLKSDGAIDYVIIPKVDRFARDRGDDAMLNRWVRKQGAQLVSCAENIDDSPSGQLVHGMMAVLAEFYSANLRTEVIKGMRQKVKKGGTPGRAKLGYVNVQVTTDDGHKVRTIATDETRAPLIAEAFEWFESGRFTLETLHERVVAAGLTCRPERSRPQRPISRNQLNAILRDRYYTGQIECDGEWIEARHEAIVTKERFENVQRVLDSHSGSGVRQRRHDHYLKGAVWCQRCGNRLVLLRSVGNGGVYFYFFCRGRQLKVCDQPYMLVEDVERAVGAHYAGRRLSPEFIALLSQLFVASLDDEFAALKRIKSALAARLKQIDEQETAYVALVGNPRWPQEKLEAKIAGLRAERTEAEEGLETVQANLKIGREVMLLALDYLKDPQDLYRGSSALGRQLLNTALFGRLRLDVEVDGVRVTDSTMNEPFGALLEAEARLRRLNTPPRAYGRLSGSLTPHEVAELVGQDVSGGDHVSETALTFDDSWSDADLLLLGVLAANGWSRASMVGAAGVEPATARV